MRGFVPRCLWWGVAATCALALGGCAGSNASSSASAPASPLTRSIEAFFHALSVQQVQCSSPTSGSHGHRSCQVEFTDNYGEWWATIIVAGSTVISDPGGVADWLCATACANPPAMTANTGNPKNNPGFTASAGSTGVGGQTGVTGIGGVVKHPAPKRPPKPPKPPKVTITTPIGGTGVVYPTGSTGVVNPTGSTGVVYPTGSTGVVTGGGNTSTIGQTGATGIVYGTGSTGPGG